MCHRDIRRWWKLADQRRGRRNKRSYHERAVILSAVVNEPTFLRENGIETVTQSTTTHARESWEIGETFGNWGWQGDGCEIFGYDDNRDETGELADEEQRLADKYGTVLS